MALIFSSFVIYPKLGLGLNEDEITKIEFITNNNSEKNYIKDIKQKINDGNFMIKNNIGCNMKEIDKKYSFKKITEPENLNNTNESTGIDAIFVNYNLIENQNIIGYLQQQLEKGKTIYFYGNNIKLKTFAPLFHLERRIPKKDEANADYIYNVMEKDLVYVGVEKTDWGYTFIRGTDESGYNFYRTISLLVSDAMHSQKVKKTKPYNHKNSEFLSFNNLLFIKAYAGSNLAQYPIVDSDRQAKVFNNNEWYVITDGYLHQVDDRETDKDYFIMETITEFNSNYNGYVWVQANKFYTKLKPFYNTDHVIDGAPDDQTRSGSLFL